MKTTKIHVLCLIAIALSGCSLRDDLVPEVGQGREIVLSAVDAAAQSPDTRGEAVTALRKIGVFGYSHTGDFEEVSSAALHADYFLNKPVTDLPGDGTWTYSGVRKYWPTDNHLLSFFAYAPHIDVEHTFDLTPESTAAAGTPTIDYTVPATITEQIDLMWANRTDMTAETADGVVPFTMNHALTQVGFVVNLDVNEYGAPFRVTFDKLVVRNVLGHGTLDLSRAPADPKLWATSRPASDAGWVSYTMIPTFRDGLALLTLDASKTTFAPGDINPWDEEGVSLLREGQSLLLIPQTLMDQEDGLSPAEAVLTYTLSSTTSASETEVVKTFPLGSESVPEWTPGMNITYRITLSMQEGIRIEVDMKSPIATTKWKSGESDLGDNRHDNVVSEWW